MEPISAGIQAVGQLFKGITGYFSGQRQAKAYEYAAQQAGQEAGVASSQALSEGEAAAAQAAVQGAANGGGFVGSTLGVIQSIANRSMFNARAAAYRGATEVRNDLYNQKVAKWQATSGLVGSLIGSAADVAGGVQRGRYEARQTAALQSLRGEAPGPLDGLEDPIY